MSNDANSPVILKRRGVMFVVSSPSGAGKTTLTRRLLDEDPNVEMSVSATTRPKRPGEEDGVHYYFKSHAEFESMIEAEDFLEWARVFDNYYGTPRQPVMDALSEGRDVLFDIDWQGTQQLKDKVEKDLVRVFILPPSKKELEKRLKTRAQDSDEVVAKRMAKANDEISHWAEYDYIIVNDDLEKAEQDLFTILRAERIKRMQHAPFVAELTKD